MPVNNNLIVHSNIPCRAKDPATCRFHSAEQRMNDAVKFNDLEGYFRFRAQWEAAKVEDEVQEFLAAHPPVRQAERYRVNIKDATEAIMYHDEPFDLDYQQKDGEWATEEFEYVETVHTRNYDKQLIVRRKSDEKLFGIEYDGDGGYDGEAFYDPFSSRIRPELIEVQAEDTLKIVTTYTLASQPTVEEL